MDRLAETVLRCLSSKLSKDALCRIYARSLTKVIGLTGPRPDRYTVRNAYRAYRSD